MVREQVKKQVMQRKSYQVVPEKVKMEVGRYTALNGTKAALKRYSKIYPKYDLKRTSVNSWKSKIKDKKRELSCETGNAGTVISRRMVSWLFFVCFCFF